MKKIQAFELNNYVRPDERIVLTNTGKYLTHGQDNSYYQYVEERYIGSPTNNAVIDAYCSYIYGEGLQANIDINSIISKNDVRLAIKDLKMHGQYTLQVVYTKDRKNIAKLYHIPVKQIAVDRPLDITDPIENFWYSFDWRYQTKYRPALVPAFGTTSGKETEIAFVRTPSCEPIYSLPDYQSALQYCDLEEELSNFYNCHVKNKFSAGTIININQGFDTPEEQEEAERSILAKTTGTSNAGTVIISVNDNKENATTVEQIVIADAYNQYEWLSTEARDKILMAHKVVNPILFGIKDGGGLGNNADEMTVALKTLYRSQIKPFREIFIDGLENILAYGGTTPELYFKDFEELVVKEQPAAVPVVEEVAMSKEEFDEWTDYATASTGEIKMTKEKVDIFSKKFDEWVQLKKWRESVDSSNVRQVFYNDTLKEMVIQFNSGRFYTYFQVEMSLFESIIDGKAECLTTGTSIWGSWNKGDTPSVGAAVHQLLTGIRYQRGGRAWT